METCETNRAVGDYLGIERSVGDSISVDCANGSFEAEVKEVPDDVPVEEYQTKEVIAWGVGDDEDTYALYAQVTKMTDMRVEYDVYAVHFPEPAESGDTNDLGEIQRIEVENA